MILRAHCPFCFQKPWEVENGNHFALYFFVLAVVLQFIKWNSRH
ncbi:hypothetical protein DVDV_0814 [Desulfovibrio sp. DV]|nr:hypothetical protein DVDV_0814 [Desulfovibrio sp. DV]